MLTMDTSSSMADLEKALQAVLEQARVDQLEEEAYLTLRWEVIDTLLQALRPQLRYVLGWITVNGDRSRGVNLQGVPVSILENGLLYLGIPGTFHTSVHEIRTYLVAYEEDGRDDLTLFEIEEMVTQTLVNSLLIFWNRAIEVREDRQRQMDSRTTAIVEVAKALSR